MNAVERSSPTSLHAQQRRMEVVWSERAARLSLRPVAAGAGQNAFPVIVLGIGKERYCVSLSDVAEILPLVRVTPVPGAAGIFSGVINVHGEIRPVIDLGRLLGIETGHKSDLPRVILLRRHGREMGLQIESVEQIRSLDPANLRPAERDDVGSSHYIKGSTKELLMLLSTEALFAELHTGVTT
jgi:chemotaxis signal transduction protein